METGITRLFHTALCLVKGGMPENEIYQVLANLIISWGETPDPKWIQAKIESAMKRKTGKDRNLTQEVKDAISITAGYLGLPRYTDLSEMRYRRIGHISGLF